MLQIIAAQALNIYIVMVSLRQVPVIRMDHFTESGRTQVKLWTIYDTK